jgi:uncharacterized membrane protein YidH (DUF202 family)
MEISLCESRYGTGGFLLKMESIAVVILAVCVFLSFYFAFLTFQMVDETSKKEFMALAVSCLVASVTIFVCLMIYLPLKRAFRE